MKHIIFVKQLDKHIINPNQISYSDIFSIEEKYSIEKYITISMGGRNIEENMAI